MDGKHPVLISVIVTTYNRAVLLRRALNSIAASCGDPLRAEVIVVDNNSADSTATVVTQVREAGFRFKLIYVVERAQGLSHARNRGLKEASGEYIVFVDDDQAIDAHYLERLPLVFAEHDAVCVGGPILYDNLDSAPVQLCGLCRAHGEHSLGRRARILGPDGGRLWGGNMAFDRRELAAVDGFDVRLGHRGTILSGGEDVELQRRLHQAGKRVIYHPGLIQYHHLSDDRFRRSYWRRRYLGYGRSRYTRDSQRWHTSRCLLGIPYRFWWQLVKRDIPGYLKSFTSLDSSRVFQHELYLWRQMGRMLEARGANRGNRKAVHAADEP